ncbi:lytic transglycosylase domain-containing protein [Pseudonocardia spinosispora]|uniref:lytic transglycosylase domain-containing protein n=1 Tax=Pseudonocardia spinosispora TaxID=103441 RepID=UPI0012EBA9F9|nr:lytic murein transglycosylase [Pseudonocardia spinosispora]
MASGNGGARSAVWLLVAALALLGTVAVLHSQSAPPEEPAAAPARPVPLPGAISLEALPAPLPDESATGGTPSGELSVVDPPPGVVAAQVPAGPGGIPGAAMAAYQRAERTLATSTPGCRLSWTTLAALGRAASGHARGGQLDGHGRTLGRFLGPRLDGSPGLPRIPDTDHGQLDGDPQWDRAVGPMQIIPSTWRRYAADGDGDGQADPNDMSDAALTAGRYLCAGNVDLAVPEQQTAAFHRVNRSDSYVAAVRTFATDYARDTVPQPLAAPPPAPVPPPVSPPVSPPKPVHRMAPSHRSTPTTTPVKRTTPTTSTTPTTTTASTSTSKAPGRPNRILPPTSIAPTTAGAPDAGTPVTQQAASPTVTTVTTTVSAPPAQPSPAAPAPGVSTSQKPIPIIVLPPTDSAPRSTTAK